MAGELVGEAWVAIHARDGGMSGEIRDIAEEAGEDAAETLDKTIDRETKKRFAQDRSIMARILSQDDPQNIDRALKRWGTPDRIKERLEEMVLQVKDEKIFDAMVNDIGASMDRIYAQVAQQEEARIKKVREAQDRAFATYNRNISTVYQREEAEKYTKSVGALRMELEKLRHERERKIDDSLIRVLDSGGKDWSAFLRNLRDGEDAHEALSDSMIRLGNNYEDFRRDQVIPLVESLKDFERQQKAISDDKRFRAIAKDWEKALAMNEVYDANKQWGEFGTTVRNVRAEIERKREGTLAEALALGDIERYVRTFDNLGDAVRTFDEDMVRLRQSGRIIGDDIDRLNGMMAEYERNTREASITTIDFAEAQRRATTAVRDALDRDLAKAYGTGDWSALNKEMGKSVFITGRIRERMDELRRAGILTDDMIRDMNDSFGEFRRDNRRTIAIIDAFPNVLGKAFGRGSRNNFLNFFGSVLRNVALAGVEIGKFGARTVKTIGEVIDNFRFLRSSGAGLGSALVGAFKPLVASVAPALVAVGVGAAFLVKFLPMLASLVSALTGILVAWAGVLVNAVLGALLALVPVLVTVLGGFVALGIAVGKYYQEMKRRKEEGEELTASMKRMDDAVENMNDSFERFTDRVAPEASRSFAIMTDAVAGFLDAIGPGVEQGLRRFNNILSSKSLAPALEAWSESLPRIFADFTAGLGHMTAGLIRFFEPILPYAERLSRAFYDMMVTFNAWAGSARGQNTIADWMDMAWQSASALWGTLGNLLGALGSLFNIGTDTTGLEWLQGLEETTRRWNEELKTEEGREKVTRWFGHAKEVGETLWEILKEIGKFFRELDTEQARADLSNTLGMIEDVAGALDTVADKINAASELMSAFLSGKYPHPTGGEALDIGAQLGFGEDMDLGKSFDDKILEMILPDDVEQFVKDVDEQFAKLGEMSGTQAVTSYTDRFRTNFAISTDWWLETVMPSGVLNPASWIVRSSGMASAAWEAIATGFALVPSPIEIGALIGGRINKSLEDVDFAAIGTALWNDFKDSFSAGWETFNEDIKTGIRWAFQIDGETWSEIGANLWTDFKESVSAGWESFVEDNKEGFRRAFNVDGETWSEIGSNMWTSFKTAWSEGWVTFQEDIKNNLRQVFQVDGETWAEIGGNLWAGLMAGLWTALEANPVTGPFIKFYELVREFFGIASPSTLFMQVGSDVMQGFINGLEFVFLTLPGIIAGWLLEMSTQFYVWATALPGQVAGWLATLPAKFMENWNAAKADLTAWLVERGMEITTWVTGIPGAVRDGLATLGAKFMENWDAAKTSLSEWRTNTADDIKAWAEGIPGSITTWLSGVAGAIAAPFEAAWSPVNEALSAIYTTASGWWESIKGVIANITGASSSGRRSTIQMLGGGGVRPPYMLASGGLFDGPTPAIIGEAGREAVIPLDRPLSQINPSVRGMAAALRGGGTTFESGSIILQYAGRDPYRAAEAFLDGIAQEIA